MYDIASLLTADRETKEFFKLHFIEFFEQHNYECVDPKIVLVNINSHDDMKHVRRGEGFYLILSDYKYYENKCTLSLNGLKAIYRGHGVRIRKRVESHIFNDIYNEDRDRTNYDVCMKLDGANGITLGSPKYSKFRWAVVYHSMAESTKTIREQAEKAFDHVYGMPFGSKA